MLYNNKINVILLEIGNAILFYFIYPKILHDYKCYYVFVWERKCMFVW